MTEKYNRIRNTTLSRMAAHCDHNSGKIIAKNVSQNKSGMFLNIVALLSLVAQCSASSGKPILMNLLEKKKKDYSKNIYTICSSG